MSTGPTRQMKKRLIYIVLLAIFFGFLVVAGVVGYRAIWQSEFLQNKAINQQLRDVTISPKRGTIYDRNMEVLATSATVWTVVISPVDIKTEELRELIVENLSEILEVDEEGKQKILEQTKKNNQYEIIKSKIEEDKAEQIRQFIKDEEIGCVRLVEDSKRYYPNGSLASTVIGFAGTDQGLTGIEAYYDKYLRGTPGRVVSIKNAKGNDMPIGFDKTYAPIDGNGLVLTIDSNIQYFLEKALLNAVVVHQVKNRALGIAMDVKTGEILAMATIPDFDLNEPFKIADQELAAQIEQITDPDEKKKQTSLAQQKQWSNKAINEIYEPGSTFKVVTGSAALEEKTVSMSSTFTCTGATYVAGVRMRCWKNGGHGTTDLTGAFVGSCNPAFIAIGQSLGVDKFQQYLKDYGFGQKTGIDLPGEEKGLTVSKSNMGPVELASCSFGQSNKITPIQLITAVTAAINGGKLLTPHVVKSQLDNKGNVVSSVGTQVKRQVISEETSAQMRQMLQSAGGANAKILGYTIGGKSGTAQKLDAGEEERISSFVGFAPADDPQIAILVCVDTPTAGTAYGSVVATPVVAAAFEDILPYWGVQPKYTEEELEKLNVSIPNVTGDELAAAQNKLTQKQLDYKVVGKGTTVIKQVPAAGISVPQNSKIILYTEEQEEKEITVPNLVGLTPSQANTLATNSGLILQINGGAVNSSDVLVASQSIKEGDVVKEGTIIVVDCLNYSHQD